VPWTPSFCVRQDKGRNAQRSFKRYYYLGWKSYTINKLLTTIRCQLSVLTNERPRQCSHRNNSCPISPLQISLFLLQLLSPLLDTIRGLTGPKRFMLKIWITWTVRFVHPVLGDTEFNFILAEYRQQDLEK
jgi:hypothetical protein